MSKTPLTLSKTKRKLQQDLEHVTQEMYRRNLELAETNQALSLLRAIDTLVLESHEELGKLCSQISEAIVNTASYPFVGILAHRPHADHLRLLGWHTMVEAITTIPKETMQRAYVETTDPWMERKEETIFISAENSDNPPKVSLIKRLPIYNEATDDEKLQSFYVVKLTARQRLVGLMVIGFNKTYREVQHSDHELLERLGQAVGLALDNRLLYEENQQVLRQLQTSNKKLKALDETKDEFISMASHQLRTPLTSVKGYISMVLEGDVGAITDQQKQLLDQAFLSSQRMVYLISDLLNVSRLRTGKFVIEAKPVNLPDVVKGELQQIQEMAQSRKLTFTFEPPEHFPTLNLDETKIRQVIMNFADNALYYTPAGGEVGIALKETPQSVEFLVTDNGIGVPKSEQHHLFTKFYRAPNAQKARPDGTGLGLYMAQKIITAQGGAIIFNSEEGKGSTFGFSFPRAKLEVKETPAQGSE